MGLEPSQEANGHNYGKDSLDALPCEINAEKTPQISLENSSLNAHRTPQNDLRTEYLKDVNTHQKERHKLARQEMSYEDFLDQVIENPRQFIRGPAQYLVDMLHHFGSSSKVVLGRKIQDFNIRTRPWSNNELSDHTELVGQEIPLYEYYLENILNAKMAHPTRLYVFHGPPGSGKTLLSETIDEGLEVYSRMTEGALYRIFFEFYDPKMFNGFGFVQGVNFTGDSERDDLGDEKEERRELIFPSGNTDPLFLLPNENKVRSPYSSSLGSSSVTETSREHFYRLIEKQGKIEEGFAESYILNGRPDSVSGKIIDGLMRYYNGNFKKVLRHVRVERFYLNQSTGEGLVSIRPNPDRTAMALPMFPLRELPPVQLATVAHQLMEVRGAIHGANRGHFNFSDFLRPNEQDRSQNDLSRFNHLLETIEGGKTQIVSPSDPSNILTEPINVVFRANSNDEHIVEKMDTTSWPAFRRRCRFITVPLTIRYHEERRAHEKKLENLLDKDREVAPHVLETLSLFVVSTRILRPNASMYKGIHPDLPEIIGSLSVVEKALLLQEPKRTGRNTSINMFRDIDPLDVHTATKKVKKRLNKVEIDCLSDHLGEIADEYTDGLGDTRFNIYDGGMGVSTASAQDLIREVIKYRLNQPLTVLEVLDVLKDHSKAGFNYYLRIGKAKHAIAERMTRKEEEAATMSGNQLSRKDTEGLLVKNIKEIEKKYPISSPETLIAEIETFAKKLVREDIYQALGISTYDAQFALKQYIEHISVQRDGTGSVRKEFQVERSRESSEPDEELMRHFEDEIIQAENIDDDDSRFVHRDELLTRIGTWSRKNPNQNPDDNYEDVFPNIMDDIRKARKSGAEKAIQELVHSTRRYVGHKDVLSHDLSNVHEPMTRKEALSWKSISERLERAGYPENTIAKHVIWAADIRSQESST